MKMAVVKVNWLFYYADALAVEKHLTKHYGILNAKINPVSGIAIIGYDETKVNDDDIERIVIECGYHCNVFEHLKIENERLKRRV